MVSHVPTYAHISMREITCKNVGPPQISKQLSPPVGTRSNPGSNPDDLSDLATLCLSVQIENDARHLGLRGEEGANMVIQSEVKLRRIVYNEETPANACIYAA